MVGVRVVARWKSALIEGGWWDGGDQAPRRRPAGRAGGGRGGGHARHVHVTNPLPVVEDVHLDLIEGEGDVERVGA